MRSSLSVVFLVVTVTWLGALVAAPYAASHHGPDTATFRAAGVVYALGSVVCHQLAHRSFHRWGVQPPVCARCTGLYTGAAIGALLAFVWGLRRQTTRTSGVRAQRAGCSVRDRACTARAVLSTQLPGSDLGRIRRLLVVSALPTVLAVIAELAGAAEPSGVARAGAALPLGASVSWVVGRMLQGELKGRGID